MARSARSAGRGGLRVLVAGGGVAGLETMVALRDLVGDLVDVELLSPEPWFWYRPMSVAEPFDQSRTDRFELSALALACGASFSAGLLVGIDADARRARVGDGREIAYDVLVIAAGTRANAAVEGALTFRGPADVEAFRTILAEVEAGSTRRIAFALPRRAGWPLPLYELALLTAARVQERGLEGVDLSLVTHEQAPLGLLGADASDAVRGLLEQSGIALHTDCYPVSVEQGRLELAPAGSLVVDRVVALARLEGGPIEGVPHDGNGFIATDRRGRVHDLVDVYAAGDITRFPIKQGGIATQQADVVAEQIAARAGAMLIPKPHEPVLYTLLLTGGQPLYLKAELATGNGYRSTVSNEPLWSPPAKIAGRHLAPFLASQPGHL